MNVTWKDNRCEDSRIDAFSNFKLENFWKPYSWMLLWCWNHQKKNGDGIWLHCKVRREHVYHTEKEFYFTETLIMLIKLWMRSMNRQRTWNRYRKLSPPQLVLRLILMRCVFFFRISICFEFFDGSVMTYAMCTCLLKRMNWKQNLKS